MKNKFENTKKSQLQKANAALKSLSKDVTTTDRREAPVAESTLIDYLKGRGKDLETAMTLLRFFRGRIADRDKELAQSAA